jgi:uncharacterized protein YgbK (DUF1537 family)
VKRLNYEAATGRILVFDAQREQDVRSIAEQLKRRGLLRISAGCAGFATHLARVLGLKRKIVRRAAPPSQLLVVCGSTNPVSLEQMDWAVGNGMERIVLDPEQVMGPPRYASDNALVSRVHAILANGKDLILQTARGEGDIRRFQDYAGEQGVQAHEVPRLITEGFGSLVGDTLRSRQGLTPVVIGGDTALGIVKCLGTPSIAPIDHIAPGIVASRMVGEDFDLPLISKAGGFGAPGIIGDILRYVR